MWEAAESYSRAEASVSYISRRTLLCDFTKEGKEIEAYVVYNDSLHTISRESLEEQDQGVASPLGSEMSGRDLGTFLIPKEDDEVFALSWTLVLMNDLHRLALDPSKSHWK